LALNFLNGCLPLDIKSKTLKNGRLHLEKSLPCIHLDFFVSSPERSVTVTDQKFRKQIIFDQILLATPHFPKYTANDGLSKSGCKLKFGCKKFIGA
jgi:hypothetical protein